MLSRLRNFIYRAKYRHGRHLPLAAPVDVSLELSSHCNMACHYCYQSDQKGLPFKKGLMSWETIEKILAEGLLSGVNSVKFNWKGEPTVNPEFHRAAILAKKLSHGSAFIDRLVNTNGKFNSEREDIFLGLSTLTKAKFSFDSFRPDVFEAQRKGGIHAITQRNIDIFYNHPARIKSETEIVIQAVRTKLNENEDIVGESARRWPEATVSVRDMVSGRVEKDVSNMESRPRDASERQSCQQAHVRLIFNWEGKAYPCCPDIGEKLCLGNIAEQSLSEIFNGRVAKDLRRTLKTGQAFQTNPCRICPSFETYRGFKPAWNS